MRTTTVKSRRYQKSIFRKLNKKEMIKIFQFDRVQIKFNQLHGVYLNLKATLQKQKDRKRKEGISV